MALWTAKYVVLFFSVLAVATVVIVQQSNLLQTKQKLHTPKQQMKIRENAFSLKVKGPSRTRKLKLKDRINTPKLKSTNPVQMRKLKMKRFFGAWKSNPNVFVNILQPKHRVASKSLTPKTEIRGLPDTTPKMSKLVGNPNTSTPKVKLNITQSC